MSAHKFSPGSAIVKRKGRRKPPHSILLFDLDQKSFEIISKQKKINLFLHYFLNQFQLLFFTTEVSILKKLEQKAKRNNLGCEIRLFSSHSLSDLKQSIKTFLLDNVSEQISPASSIFVTSQFSKDDFDFEKFEFGTFQTPENFFNSRSKDENSDEEGEGSPMQIEEDNLGKDFNEFTEQQSINLDSNNIDRIEEEEVDNDHAPKRANLDLHFAENTKEDFEFIRGYEDQAEELPSFYFEKMKELSSQISRKLNSKIDQICNLNFFQDDSLRDLDSPKSLAGSFEVNEDMGSPFIREQRQSNFEEELFQENLLSQAGRMEIEGENKLNSEVVLEIETSKELLSRLNSLNFEVVNDNNQPITTYMRKMKKKQMVERLNSNQKPSKDEEILIYVSSVPGEKPITFPIKGYDLQRLEPDTFLNDSLIQFYLKLIHSEFVEEYRKSSFYIFNTYLLDKLVSSSRGEQGSLENFDKAYEQVKKWTKDVDIFSKDFLLFPFHDKQGTHWGLFVCCFAQFFGRTDPDDFRMGHVKKPYLLYFDSFQPLNNDVANIVVLYLEHELRDKKPQRLQEIQNRDKVQTITKDRIFQLIVPLQHNYSDCGVYLLEYAERFMMNPQEILADIAVTRDKRCLFPKSIFQNKRKNMAEIILGLAKEDKTCIQEYLKKKKQMLEDAKNNPDEIEEIEPKELQEFFKEEFNIDVKELDSIAQDQTKIRYYTQLRETELAKQKSKASQHKEY